jgi:DNA-binding beta-propeller fold protein YncE
VANFTDNVSMINGATCDATVTSGCGQTPPTVSAGNLPFDVAVDQASDTVYVLNLLGDSVTVINGLTCNATITSGCRGPQRTVEVGGIPLAVAASSATHTAYVANAADSDVSVFGPRG